MLGITKKKATSGVDVRAALAVVINRNLDSVKKCQGDFFYVSRKMTKPFFYSFFFLVRNGSCCKSCCIVRPTAALEG